MKEIKFTINIPPITKKNHIMFGKNKYTGKTFIRQAPAYYQYEKDFLAICPNIETINFPINVKAIYYMPTKRKVDLINLHAALHDCLVKKGVIIDDNSNIIASTDGSRVYYDKCNPRTEITISYDS